MWRRKRVVVGLHCLFLLSGPENQSMAADEQAHKLHRTHKSGASSKKRPDDNADSEKKLTKQQQKQHNPKAFAFNSNAKAKRLQSRATEKEQRRLDIRSPPPSSPNRTLGRLNLFDATASPNHTARNHIAFLNLKLPNL